MDLLCHSIHQHVGSPEEEHDPNGLGNLSCSLLWVRIKPICVRGLLPASSENPGGKWKYQPKPPGCCHCSLGGFPTLAPPQGLLSLLTSISNCRALSSELRAEKMGNCLPNTPTPTSSSPKKPLQGGSRYFCTCPNKLAAKGGF